MRTQCGRQLYSTALWCELEGIGQQVGYDFLYCLGRIGTFCLPVLYLNVVNHTLLVGKGLETARHIVDKGKGIAIHHLQLLVDVAQPSCLDQLVEQRLHGAGAFQNGFNVLF